jgi:hypothetical protein
MKTQEWGVRSADIVHTENDSGITRFVRPRVTGSGRRAFTLIATVNRMLAKS